MKFSKLSFFKLVKKDARNIKRRQIDLRSASVQAVVFTAFMVVSIRLLQIQVFNADKYEAMARDQQMKVTKIIAKRGTIYTSDAYPLAFTSTKYYMTVDKNKIININETVTRLNRVIDLSMDELNGLDEDTTGKLDLNKNMFTKEITYDQKLKLEGIEDPSVTFSSDVSRFYPEDTMLSHVLGIIGQTEEGDVTGYYGLEQFYNGDLQGQNGADIEVKSANGAPILHAEFDKIPSINGSDLYLTVNRDIQFLIEESLASGVKKYNAKTGTVVVVDPFTGKVLAMASYPSFTPASEVTDLKALTNQAVSSVYEPGSIMKPVTIASALQSGKVNLGYTYKDTGPRVYSGHKVDNWDGKHHGTETISTTLQHSNNLATASIGLKLGGDYLEEYFIKFGFGTITGIDLDGEESGLFDSSAELRDIEVANMSFGQGIAVTPIQMVMAYSVIANGGIMMKPYVVDKIVTSDSDDGLEKIVYQYKPQKIGRVISKDISDTMIGLLNQAVNGGEAKFFVSKKFNISGKTGTAQIPVKGGYDKNKTNASFIGFFTRYKNFVMLVKLEEPTFPSGFAAETAVPLWMDLAEKMAGYYNLKPDRILVSN